ncbi:MAG: hypothetical protein WCS94_05785 [Verrucomicrobiota bacterium]
MNEAIEGRFENGTTQGTVEIMLFREDQELYFVAKSAGRRQKEIAIRRKQLARLLWTLRGLARNCAPGSTLCG